MESCKVINPCMKIQNRTTNLTDYVGLFDFSYSDIKNSQKISLRDVGILAYGCFIDYEPERKKLFDELEKWAVDNPTKSFWVKLNKKRRLMYYKDRYPDRVELRIKSGILPKDKIHFNLFTLRTSVDCILNPTSKTKINDIPSAGINPLTVGFIVTPIFPIAKYRIWYKLSQDRREIHTGTIASNTRSWDYLYPGAGIYEGYFIVQITTSKLWQRINFVIKIEGNPAKPEDIITNFYQTKASGGDTAFSIATGRSITKIKWDFGDGNKRLNRSQTEHNVYSIPREKPYHGTVTAWSGSDYDSRDFYVIV